MEKITLHLDEDVQPTLAKILKQRGFDVATPQEENMLGKSNRAQLEFAIKSGRAILTYNIKDFVSFAREYAERNRSHNGIIVSDHLELKELLRRILKLLSTYSSSEMKNHFVWLHNFK
ncbi:DUF5615 family PIN-like protein [Candidatus Aerophobetes bacterium]|nr:DUF5615 family PIN-like protein [Candidatus Aerophobetes bacterium]